MHMGFEVLLKSFKTTSLQADLRHRAKCFSKQWNFIVKYFIIILWSVWKAFKYFVTK